MPPKNIPLLPSRVVHLKILFPTSSTRICVVRPVGENRMAPCLNKVSHSFSPGRPSDPILRSNSTDTVQKWVSGNKPILCSMRKILGNCELMIIGVSWLGCCGTYSTSDRSVPLTAQFSPPVKRSLVSHLPTRRRRPGRTTHSGRTATRWDGCLGKRTDVTLRSGLWRCGWWPLKCETIFVFGAMFSMSQNVTIQWITCSLAGQ